MLSENFEKNVLILTLYRIMSHYWNFIKQHQIKFIFIMLKTERIKCLCWNFTENYTFNGNEWTKLILHYLETDEIEINFHN